MESAVTQSQREDVNFIGNHGRDNVTSFSVEFDWASWMVELNTNPVYKAAVFISQYYSFIISAIGVPCNILSFLVLRRIKPLSSALLIMMILAVADSMNLLVEVFVSGMGMMHISYTNIWCCAFNTVRYIAQYMPIWLVILLTIERVVAVCFPMKVAQICTIPSTCRSVILLLILDLLICIPHTFIYEAKQDVVGAVCRVKFKYERLFEQLKVADNVFFVFLPLILLSLCNMAIIIKLRMSTGIHNETISSSGSEENKRQNRSVTVMLLAVSITTIISLGPNIALSLIGNTWVVSVNVTTTTYARQQLLAWTIMFLTLANNAINFFLYILSGRRFRTELYNMVTSWFRYHITVNV